MTGAKLNSFKFALAGGIVAALCIFVTTMGTAIWGLCPDYTALIADIYGFLGFKASFLGAVLGAIYGFIDGFILVGLFALIYNKLL